MSTRAGVVGQACAGMQEVQECRKVQEWGENRNSALLHQKGVPR